MKEFKRNNIDILLEKTPSTPRYALNLFFKLNKKEKYFGINSLLARLLLQGTKKFSAAQLALEFENECIDISTKAKQDYIKLSLVFLNEDFKRAVELVKDLILNSTFDDFEKEVFKIKGEIISDLDNPKLKLTDAFIKNLYKNHPYSSCHTKILDDLDKITKQDIIEAHKSMLNTQKAVVLVGDYDNEDEILNYIEKEFSFMQNKSSDNEIEDIYSNDIKNDELIWLNKNDASQAQIIQGWIVDSFNSKMCAKIAVMNNILGSSGLSSRLFVNLRDKQGLAYTVRSQYETMLHSAVFSMYIGTAPKNIQKSLDGFKDELRKLAIEEISEKELKGARENISGRLKYFTQNNSQIAAIQGYNYIMGLGLEYNKLFLEDVNNVTSKDVNNIAKTLSETPKLITIIAPEEYKIAL